MINRFGLKIKRGNTPDGVAGKKRRHNADIKKSKAILKICLKSIQGSLKKEKMTGEGLKKMGRY